MWIKQKGTVMKVNQIDFWWPVWFLGGLVLAMTGRIPLWVFLLVVASHIKVTVNK